MSKKDEKRFDLKVYTDPFAGNMAPKWPTTVTARRRDGRVTGVDGSVWLYRAVPLRAVADAKTTGARLDASSSLSDAFAALSDLTSLNGALRRQMVKSNYRHFHMLLVNVPVFFDPPHDHPLYASLLRDHGEQLMVRRVLMIGVRLRSSLAGRGGGLKGAVDSIVETFTSSGVAMSDFDADYDKVDAALSRAGCVPLTVEEMRLADSWFNHGISNDPIMRPGPSHLSVFLDAKSAEFAARTLGDTPVDAWPEIKGHQAITFASVQELDMPWVPATSPRSQWISQLLDAGALAVSVRGQVEPPSMTKKELEAQRRRYVEDIQERYEQNKLSKAEQEETLAVLESVRGAYGQDGTPPTLVDTSAVIAFDGMRNADDILSNGSAVRLNELTHRQPAALMEMWPASHYRANPHRLDLPSTSVAYAGATSLSRVGDRPESGAALIGFTERDRQPAWWNPRSAYENSMSPVWLVAGASGSGKSYLLLHMADQVARAGNPVVIVDPSPMSDMSDAVANSGGYVASLDDLISVDGVFDPLRSALDPDLAVDMAVSAVSQVRPWGDQTSNMEVPLTVAIQYGVAHGATCIGEALKIAYQSGQASKELVMPVMSLAKSSALFRAMCGVNPKSKPLSVADGITCIRVGSANLALPEPGAAVESMNLSQRISLALVRLMVTGSLSALTHRNGLLLLDEAWVFLGAGNVELERLARVARKQTVTCALFTQRVSDATTAGIDEHIAGGFILPLNRKEAAAACELLRLDPTPERLDRITAKAERGDIDSAQSMTPNWDSMRFLRDPETGKTLRGTIALYCDINDRVVPVEVTVPAEFGRKASSDWRDVQARKSDVSTGGATRQSSPRLQPWGA